MKKGSGIKKVSVLLALLMALCLHTAGIDPAFLSAEAEGLSQGIVNDGIEWEINDGVLTITGDGKMKDQNFYFNDLYCWRESALNTVVISEGITEIGEYSFGDCAEVRSVQIPSSVYRIHPTAFVRCRRLELDSLPESVREIGHWAFEDCDAITAFVISPTVSKVQNGIFHNCDSLRSVVMDPSAATVPNYTFRGCINLSEITIGSHIEEIGTEAFAECFSLENITLPSSVRMIRERAFISSGLKSIYFDSVELIEAGAFKDCLDLTDVYYGGSEEEWNEIFIEEKANERLLNANIHFNASAPEDGSVSGSDIVSIGSLEVPRNLLMVGIIALAALMFSLVAALIARSRTERYAPAGSRSGMPGAVKLLVLALYIAAGSAALYYLLDYLR